MRSKTEQADMKVLHVSAECYPVAKAGGLGDVVGALPKYLAVHGQSAGVVLPKYDLKWVRNHRFTPIYRGAVRLHHDYVPFAIEKEADDSLGYPLFVVNIPGLFDRPGIYADPGGWGYGDEVERYICFQQAILQWIAASPGRPEVLHCHDHHTGLIPFMIKYCPEYRSLANIPTVFTIHNGQYHGAFSWQKLYLLPFFEAAGRGLLDWNNTINPLAAGIKCAWRVTTVSPSYLRELAESSNGLEHLIRHEWHKCSGILNGIDAQVWDPHTDQYLSRTLQGDHDLEAFKRDNKLAIAQQTGLNPALPMMTFIGRLVGEKGADLLPDLFRRVLASGMRVGFAVLGTGEPWVGEALRQVAFAHPDRCAVALEYNENLAHLLYAGSDFLLMPSRVEPCGLNQMYAMRYASIPIVRRVGGLSDTVPDVGEPDGDGRGFQFSHFSVEDAFLAIYRAADFYHNSGRVAELRDRIRRIDFSWEHASLAYVHIYSELTS
jgi:starch synthase